MTFKTFKNVALSLTLFLSFNSNAQDQEYTGGWHTLLLKHKINSKFTVKNELHIRRAQFYSNWQQLLIRPGLDYSLTDNTTLSAGYSFIRNYSENGHALEHNVWEEIGLSNTVKSVGIKHRFRFEQRFSQTFIDDKYTHANRFRYRLTLSKKVFQIKEDKPLKAVVFNELWLHTGNGIKPQSINQNWFYTGLSMPLNNTSTLSAGYLNIHMPIDDSTNITQHVLQIGLTIKI